MEQVLDLYEAPYDPRRPVVCFDERPYQLLDHVRPAQPMRPGSVERLDYEYKRQGSCSLFVAFEPLQGWRQTWVRRQRRKVDFAAIIRELAEVHYPEAERLLLVCDNLNTHNGSSFYEAFEPEEARRLARRVEFVYTPEHGSWLNMAEIELSALARQCLGRRLASMERLAQELAAWTAARNTQGASVAWRFTTGAARNRLRTLYPSIQP